MVAKGNLGMDKKYMLDAVRARLSELNNNYRYAGDRNLKAESLKVFRSRTYNVFKIRWMKIDQYISDPT